MSTFTVSKGKRYKAVIKLGSFEQLAPNSLIAEKLAAAGFANVSVAGYGATRTAQATWPGADVTAEIPPEVASVIPLAA